MQELHLELLQLEKLPSDQGLRLVRHQQRVRQIVAPIRRKLVVLALDMQAVALVVELDIEQILDVGLGSHSLQRDSLLDKLEQDIRRNVAVDSIRHHIHKVVEPCADSTVQKAWSLMSGVLHQASKTEKNVFGSRAF